MKKLCGHWRSERGPCGAADPARGSHPTDTQAEVRPAPPRPTARRAARSAPRRPRQPPPSNQRPARRRRRGRGYADHALWTASPSATRRSGGALNQSPLGKGGFMQILRPEGPGGRRKGVALGEASLQTVSQVAGRGASGAGAGLRTPLLGFSRLLRTKQMSPLAFARQSWLRIAWGQFTSPAAPLAGSSCLTP